MAEEYEKSVSIGQSCGQDFITTVFDWSLA